MRSRIYKLRVDLRVSTPRGAQSVGYPVVSGPIRTPHSWYPCRNRPRPAGLDSYPLDRGQVGYGRLALDRLRHACILPIGAPLGSYRAVSGEITTMPGE